MLMLCASMCYILCQCVYKLGEVVLAATGASVCEKRCPMWAWIGFTWKKQIDW